MKRCYHRGSSWLELFFATWPVWLQCRLMPLILCVSPQIRRRWDTNVVKNIRIFILKSSRNSLFSCCLTGAEESKPASLCPGESCFTCPMHILPSAASVVAQDSLLFILLPLPLMQRFLSLSDCWKCGICLLLQCLDSSTSILRYSQVSLCDLYQTWQKKKKDRKITYFLQLKHILSKICLPLSVKYFIRTRKPFHPMLYTLILIHCFIFLGCTKWWHT